MTSKTENYLLKEDNNSEEQNEMEFCVICCSPVKSDYGNKKSFLSGNLEVIFLLSKVLQVPDYQLEENLREYGDPMNWVRLCEQCGQLTKQAEDLYWNIVRIEKELRSVQHLIVEKVKSSSLGASRLHLKSVWRITREFTRKCEPLVDNPFIEGDKLADYLVSQQCRLSCALPDNQSYSGTEHDQKFRATGSALNIKLEVNGEDMLLEDDWSQDNYYDDGKADVEMEVKLEMATEENDEEYLPNSRANYKRKKRIRVNGKWKCRYCDELFVGVSTCYLHENGKHKRLDEHLKVRVPNRSFVRSSVSTSTTMRKRRNQKMIRINGKFKCRHCDKLFAAMSTCTLHEKEKHPRIPGQFPCDICGKPWNSRDYLRDHRRSVHGITPDGTLVVSKKKKEVQSRNISNRSSSLLGVGKKYRKAEKVDGKWKCRHCDQMFSAASSCYLHEREKHADKPGEHICDICGKPWNSRDYLRDHRRSVHGVNPDGTTVVLVKKRKRTIKWRVPGEDPVKKPEVELKKKRKRDKDGARVKKVKKEKIKMEMVDGKWKCRHCDQLFAAKSTCYVHEREKHASKPGEHICDVCGKTWNSRDYLRDHRRSKHGLNPDGSRVENWNEKVVKFKKEKTKCHFCDKVFACQRTCDFHEKEKHAEIPQGQFICDICGKSWNTWVYLQKHRGKHKANPDGTPIIKRTKTKTNC